MSFFVKEVTGKKLTLKFKLLILIIIVIGIYFSYPFIFESMGRILIVPENLPVTADLILFEEEIMYKDGIGKCNDLFYSKNCKEVWMVRLPDTAIIIPEHKIEKAMQETLDSLGIKFRFKFIQFNTEHPFTLNKSLKIIDSLNAYGYKNIILLTNGFHSKRSLNVYKKIFANSGINIYCATYFGNVTPSNWWENSNGFRRVISEYLKFVYYWTKGYI